MKLPNIWGPGSLFAFSGLDGPNSYENSLVGTLNGDKPGVVFHTKQRRELCFSYDDIEDITYEIVSSDVVKLELTARNLCRRIPVVFLFNSQDTVIGYTGIEIRPYVICEDRIPNICNECIVHSCEGEYTSFIKKVTGEMVHFAFSYSNKSVEDAVKSVKLL